MSDQRATEANPMFAKAFIPGLVLGVIVGLVVGVFAAPYLFDRSPALKTGGGTSISTAPRDARPMPATPPLQTDSATPSTNPKPGEPTPDPNKLDPNKPDPNKPAPDPAKTP